MCVVTVAVGHYGHLTWASTNQEGLRGEIPYPCCYDEQRAWCCQGDIWYADADKERQWQDPHPQEHACCDWRSEMGPGVEGTNQPPNEQLQNPRTSVCIKQQLMD